MRALLLLAVIELGWGQRTASICGLEGDVGKCATVETSRIGALRYEDYRVVNVNAPLVNLETRRAQLTQFTLDRRGPLCVANADAANINAAPTVRYSAVRAQVSEVEVLSGGLLNQEVYAQVTVDELRLSDGFATPQFVFRIARNRGTSVLVLTMDPAYLGPGQTIADYTTPYVLTVDTATGKVGYPRGLPPKQALVNLFWGVAVNAWVILNERADIKVVDPPPFGRLLFTPAEVRQFADQISRAVVAYANPTFAPIVDASCTKTATGACVAQDTLEQFGDLLAVQGSEYVALGALTPARVLGANLAAWANGGALASATPRNLLAVLKPLGALWPVLQNETALPVADRTAIGNWWRGLVARVAEAATLPDWRGSEAAAVRMMDAVTRRDDAVFRQGVERYRMVLEQMRADGSLPMEAQRGPCALTYTNRSIAALVTIAEIAAAQGFDLYSLEVNGKSIDKAIAFLLDAYDNTTLVQRYYSAAGECELFATAGVERKALEITAGASAPAAWAEIYVSRLPNSALAARLRTRLGLSGLSKRPLWHLASGGNTSCLFVTPQELTPLNQPLLDAAQGNNQTGATRTVLPERIGARVRTGTGVPLPNVLVQYLVVRGTATVEQASVLTDPFGIAAVRVTLGARSGPVEIRASMAGAAPVVFQLTARGDDPKLAAGGIAGVGGSVPALRAGAPGTILSLYGADFVAAGRGRRAALENGKLPTVLEGVCVYFGTVAAPMLDAYPTQLNVIVPQVAPGAVDVRVAKQCGTANEERTDAQTYTVAAVSPEFFFFERNASGVNAAAAVDAVTGEFFGPLTLFEGNAKPARPGDFVTVYLNGMGATTPAVEPGAIASGAAQVRGNVVVKLAGQVLPAANVLYAGFSPGSLIYQVNFRVPPGLPASNQPIEISVDGVATPPGAYITLALR